MGNESKKPKADEELAVNQDGEGAEGGGAPDPTIIAEALGELKATLKGKGVEAGTGQLAIIRAAIDALGGESDGDGAEGGDGEVTAESKAVRDALELATDATTETVIGALKLKGGSTSDADVKVMRERVDVLEKVEGDRKVDDVIATHMKAGRINPNVDEDLLKIMRKMAGTDPDALDKLLPPAGSAIPPQGETYGPKTGNKRSEILRVAKVEHDADPGGAIATCEEYLNGALIESGLSTMTDEEKTELVTV
jgi:hypothetical protein